MPPGQEDGRTKEQASYGYYGTCYLGSNFSRENYWFWENVEDTSQPGHSEGHKRPASETPLNGVVGILDIYWEILSSI